MLVAVDGVVLGSFTFVPDAASPRNGERLEDGEAGISMLAVVPSAQRRGNGRALLDACVPRAVELDPAAVLLHTTPSMTVARHMYARAGFERLPELDWLPVPEVPLLA